MRAAHGVENLSDSLADQTRHKLLAEIVHSVGIGLIVLDAEERLVLWNSWVEKHAPLSVGLHRGRKLTEVFPDLEGGRVHGAVRGVLLNNYSSVLSQSLNKAPFPFHTKNRMEGTPDRIQQAIQVTPLDMAGGKPHCLVQIFDVTCAVAREKMLRQQALELRVSSYIDGLTGIANRRRFDEYLDNEFRRARRAGAPLSLIMADLDWFKAYNDNYGHQAGDACLVQVVAAFSAVLRRPADLLARYGGEEFVVVLPETGSPGALLIAETMRAKVEELRIAHAHATTADHVTVSFGLATVVPGRDSLAVNLLAAADQALYRAKREGRNRVAVYDDQAT